MPCLRFPGERAPRPPPLPLGSRLIGEGRKKQEGVDQATWYGWVTGSPPSSHRLRHRDGGSAFGRSDCGSQVAFTRVCHLSVSVVLSLPAPPPASPSTPFLLWSLPSLVIAACTGITLWAPPSQGPGLPCAPQPPGPGKGCPLGRGCTGLGCPHHNRPCAQSASFQCGRVPRDARPGLQRGTWDIQQEGTNVSRLVRHS